MWRGWLEPEGGLGEGCPACVQVWCQEMSQRGDKYKEDWVLMETKKEA